jgi:hypothetical protein
VETALALVDSTVTDILGYARRVEEKIDYPKDKRIPVGIITGFLGSGTLSHTRVSHPLSPSDSFASQARRRCSTTS